MMDTLGLMARRSPEPDPGVLYTPLVNGHIAISTLHRRGELLVVVPPPWIASERIMYRVDRQGA